MALDAYSACPCGSGKKFKWCCQPIHVQINQAFDQDNQGQHESALRIMDDVLAQHPDNPEAWGRKAQLLYQNDRIEEAETTLQKALDINPKYPFGYLLRGMFRYHEGELPGALLLFHKAADHYDPEALDHLGQVYAMIAECEFKLHRPVAARAAMKIATRCHPGNEELRQSFESIFGDQSHLPLSARREYTFRSLPPSAPARQAWDQALAAATTGKLADAVRAFEKLTAADPENGAAWYNLGVARAWVGDNRGAIAALDQYVGREADEGPAAAAWTLAEVLRCGQGMEEEANYLEYAVNYQTRDARAVVGFLQEWESQHRLIGVNNNPDQGFVTALVLQQPSALTTGPAAPRIAGLGAYMLLLPDRLRFWGPSRERLDKIRAEVEQRIGPGLSAGRTEESTASFTEVTSECLAFPVNLSDQEAKRRVVESMQRFFEETWIHRPLRSLNQVAPIEAAGHATLRKKVQGAVQFLAECLPPAMGYDFDHLRRKLSLLDPAPAAPNQENVAPDVGAMSAAELAAVSDDALADETLEQAYQTALKLDARDLAGRFARSLVARPPRPGRTDRYPWYFHLVQLAMNEGNTDTALHYVDEGERADCEHNEGRRRNDYELRRGQVHAKRGEADAAQGVFERLIERAPADLRFRGSAAEAMLSAKQTDRALHFAEGGLAKAREQNNRDSESYFKELVAAAQRGTQG